MRILLSAYACEPNKGSEPAVGWNWAIHLARRGHQVWVITRSNNQASIDQALVDCPEAPNLHFVYFDLSPRIQRWKKDWLGVHAYYGLWQRGAVGAAMELHTRSKFDIVHHVTFVGLRQPSYMWRLGIPFILGPVAGGERAPMALRRHFSLKSWLADLLRDGANMLARFNPVLLKSLAAAEKILVTSVQTRDLIPRRYREKTRIHLAIGMSNDELNEHVHRPRIVPDGTSLKILYVGRFLDWKGMGLAIPAFARLSTKHPQAELTLIGKGPARRRWRTLAERLGIAGKIRWIEWVPREEMMSLYAAYDVMLFPSLHDSGGMVVLEAMAQGLPVVCLDLGGPSLMVDASCGIKVATQDRSEGEVISALSRALETIADPAYRQSLSQGALSRPRAFLWNLLLDNAYGSSSVKPGFNPIGQVN